MKRTFSLLVTILLGVVTLLADDNPVLMTVDGKDVTRSEFEYFFFKNNGSGNVDRQTLDEYAQMYLNFKLKVAAAEAAGLDTVSTFVDEFRHYRDAEAEKYLLDNEWLEQQANRVFLRSKLDNGPKGVFSISMITILPEDNTISSVNAAKVRIDSIRQAIVDGADFHEMAYMHSQDLAAQRGGQLGWQSQMELPEGISEAVYSLNRGDLSQPYLSEYGWELFLIEDQKTFENFEDHRASIMEWMLKGDYYELSKKEKAKKVAEEYGWDLTPEQSVARLDSLLEEIYPEFGNVSREYHDGLLMFDISSSEIWNGAAQDTASLNKWFNKNRRDYIFPADRPRFKGVICFCRDESAFLKAKNALASVPESAYVSRISELNSDSVIVKVLPGPFVKGVSSFCDNIVFGEGECISIQGFPYTGYVGRIITEPDDWTDVSGAVIGDFQNSLEKKWVKSLRRQFKFKINRKVLSTVGNHD